MRTRGVAPCFSSAKEAEVVITQIKRIGDERRRLKRGVAAASGTPGNVIRFSASNGNRFSH